MTTYYSYHANFIYQKKYKIPLQIRDKPQNGHERDAPHRVIFINRGRTSGFKKQPQRAVLFFVG